MTIEDKRLDHLRKQLDAHGLFCTRRMDGDPVFYRFSISHDPEIELVLNKELLATSSWLFTQRVDEAVCAMTNATRNSRRGTLTMRFLDVAWNPKLPSH
jgi:hypothetical protein